EWPINARIFPSARPYFSVHGIEKLELAEFVRARTKGGDLEVDEDGVIASVSDPKARALAQTIGPLGGTYVAPEYPGEDWSTAQRRQRGRLHADRASRRDAHPRNPRGNRAARVLQPEEQGDRCQGQGERSLGSGCNGDLRDGK